MTAKSVADALLRPVLWGVRVYLPPSCYATIYFAPLSSAALSKTYCCPNSKCVTS